MWERLVYWESLEYIAKKQEVDHIDLLVYLLSKHERFRIKVIAGNFLVHASDTEVLIENYQIYKQRMMACGQIGAGIDERY
jgi:hypothetical protein